MDVTFGQTQRRIGSLPQELQDLILKQLIKSYLQPGKIFLDTYARLAKRVGDGWRYEDRYTYEVYRVNYPNLDISIFKALDKWWTEFARRTLYRGNTYVLPLGLSTTPLKHFAFFRRWDIKTRKLIASVEIDMSVKESPSSGFLSPKRSSISRLWYWRTYLRFRWFWRLLALDQLRLDHLRVDCRWTYTDEISFFAQSMRMPTPFYFPRPVDFEILARRKEEEDELRNWMEQNLYPNQGMLQV